MANQELYKASIVVLTLFCFFNNLFMLMATTAAISVPALFIFGDSTADVGTNNFLPLSKAKANFQPYGIDLVPSSPTGRFSNGLNTVDFVAILMGFKRSPPSFLSLKCFTDARNGVNFASGGSGILDSTGQPFVQFVSMSKQLSQFMTIRKNLTAQMGAAPTKHHLSHSVFLLSTGSNDLFQTFASLGPLEYYAQKSALVAALVRIYKHQIKKLYHLGARKIGIVSIPPVGCCPSQRRLNSTGGCLDVLNDSALEMYYATEAMLKDLSEQFPDLKFSLGNGYELLINFFKNSAALGFTEVKSACCGSGRFNGESICQRTSKICANRDKVLFWDLFHPSQAASKLAAQTLFAGSTQFVTPINLAQLAAA